MENLTKKQTSYLKSLAHHLDPVLTLGGKGITDTVLKSMEENLHAHELIKVKISSDDKSEFQQLASTLATESGSFLVASIGRIGIYYRARKNSDSSLGKKTTIKLPKD